VIGSFVTHIRWIDDYRDQPHDLEINSQVVQQITVSNKNDKISRRFLLVVDDPDEYLFPIEE
jgi:hypothetical protein